MVLRQEPIERGSIGWPWFSWGLVYSHCLQLLRQYPHSREGVLLLTRLGGSESQGAFNWSEVDSLTSVNTHLVDGQHQEIKQALVSWIPEAVTACADIWARPLKHANLSLTSAPQFSACFPWMWKKVLSVTMLLFTVAACPVYVYG